MKQTHVRRLIYLILPCLIYTSASALTLEQVLRTVDRSYPLLLAAQEEIQIAQAEYLSAQGPFDARIESSNFGTPQGGYEHISSDTALHLPLQSVGGEVSLGYRIGRGDWPSYDKNYLTNTAGELSARLQLPLLRGLTVDQRRTLLRNTRLGIDLKSAEYAEKRIKIKREAGLAYWAWTLELKRLSLIQQLLRVAKERQSALERRHELGDSSNIQVVENMRFILQRKELLRLQVYKARKAKRLLSLYLRDEKGDLVEPKSQQQNINELEKKLSINKIHRYQDNKKRILSNHPMLSAFEKHIAIERNRLKLSNNNLLPSLDLSYKITSENGLGGDPLKKKAAHKLGLNFQTPIQRRKAKGQRHKQVAKINQYQQYYTLAMQRLGVAFSNTIDEINTAQSRTALLDNEVKLAKKIEKAERISFSQGTSSLFLVNQRETSTFSVKLKALKVLLESKVAILNLRALSNFQD